MTKHTLFSKIKSACYWRIKAFFSDHERITKITYKAICNLMLACIFVSINPVICKITGLILHIYGIKSNRSHLKALGYYLLGSGRSYWLTPQESLILVENCEHMRIDWYEADCFNANNGDLYKTVGKFRIRSTANHFILYDVYQFYATLSTNNGSKYGKTEVEKKIAEDKNGYYSAKWNDISVDAHLTIFRDIDHSCEVEKNNITVSLSSSNFGITFSDKIFQSIGKSFAIRGRVEKTEVNASTLRRLSHYQKYVYDSIAQY